MQLGIKKRLCHCQYDKSLLRYCVRRWISSENILFKYVLSSSDKEFTAFSLNFATLSLRMRKIIFVGLSARYKRSPRMFCIVEEPAFMTFSRVRLLYLCEILTFFSKREGENVSSTSRNLNRFCITVAGLEIMSSYKIT